MLELVLLLVALCEARDVMLTIVNLMEFIRGRLGKQCKTPGSCFIFCSKQKMIIITMYHLAGILIKQFAFEHVVEAVVMKVAL